MCRHLAYVGPRIALRQVLTDPPHSLRRQAWEPRRQRYGTVNADGFGVGWWAPHDPVPARYRRTGPVWGDASFADLCRVVRSHGLVGAVRDATEGCAADESAAAPYAAGRWLFSHHGAIDGWPRSVVGPAAALLPETLLSLEARCDAALAWALVRQRLAAAPPTGDVPGGDRVVHAMPAGAALADVARLLAEAAPASRLNFLLSDGRTVAATAWGDELWYLHRGDRSLVVASEPYDDDARWTPVPDRHLLTGGPSSVRLTPLDASAPPYGTSSSTTAWPAAPPAAEAPHQPLDAPTAKPADAPAHPDRQEHAL